MQILSKIKISLTLMRTANVQNPDTIHCWPACGAQELSLLVRTQDGITTQEDSLAYFYKNKHVYHMIQQLHSLTFTQMSCWFTFTQKPAHRTEQFIRNSQGIDKLWHVQMMKHYLVLNKNGSQAKKRH